MLTPNRNLNYRLFSVSIFLLLVLSGLAACKPEPEEIVPHVDVVVDGLINPLGLAAMPDGSILIAEEGTGNNDLSAGVSLYTADGQIGRLVSGISSTRDSGDLSGSPLVALSPDEATIYVGSYGIGHLWTLPVEPGEPLSLPAQPYTPEELGKAMEPLNNVKLANPFDLTFDMKGVPVVTDSTGDGVAKENPDGTTRFIHRFEQLPDTSNDKVTISPVPTGIERVGAEYYVTLLGGCPYPPGSGRLVAIDEYRNERIMMDDLNMPIDVAQAEDGTIWILEFATFTPDASCFSGMGYQQNSGRLSRITEGVLEPVVTGLNFPGAVLPMPDGSLYVTEVFDGELLHITFGPPDEEPAESAVLPDLDIGPPVYKDIPDMDAALATVISQRSLKPSPGQELRQGETDLTRLGQALFFDPLLSGDLNISCATCHHPAAAMADARVLPIGAGGAGLGPTRDFLTEVSLAAEASMPRRQAGVSDPETGVTQVTNPFIGNFVPRNSPSILNAALLPIQFWDGRVQSTALDQPVSSQEAEVNKLGLTSAIATQALFPLTSMHEMAGATLGDLAPMTIRRAILYRLEANETYRQMFTAAFGTDEITAERLALAIAAFESRFVFTDSPWDDYIAGDKEALRDDQKRGALLFYGGLNEKVNCAQCHSGDLLTDLAFHNILTPQLGPGKGHGVNGREDYGRSFVSFDRRDWFKFRTPGLRNVALTAPYMHSGAYATLEAAVRHHINIWESAANYDPSAHLPPAHFSSLRPFNLEDQGQSADEILAAGLPMTEQDVADLVAFMQALTDPNAVDLTEFIPESVPSGLPLDPIPDAADMVAFNDAAAAGALVDEEPEPTAPFGWQFVDATEDVGLAFRHGAFAQSIYEDPAAMMGGGLCWVDVDNDGWLDLYIVNSHAEEEADYWAGQGGLPRNGLFRSSEGQFTDISAGSGADLAMRGNGCLATDLNGDGWTDLYVTADGPNAMLINNGDGTFSEVAEEAGVDAPEWNSVAVAADLNGDGWADLFVGSFIDLENEVPKPTGAFPGDYYGLPDRLYLSSGPDADGRVTFRDVSRAAGLARDERALGAIFSDLDGDGDLDLYIANDGQANRLYVYEPWPGGAAADPEGIGFRYEERTRQAEVGDTGSGMGVAGGDYDGDGQFDLFVTNWEAELNAIYRNETAEEGFLNFRYSTYRIGMRGLGNDMTGWGTTWADFDHDTDQDLLVVNGRVPVSNWETDPELVRLYGNRTSDGHTGEYFDWTSLVGLNEVGPLLARGSAVADFDNDGDLDVAVNQIGRPAVILRNEGGADSGNWLMVALAEFQPGAVVTVVLGDGRNLLREAHAGSSYLATEDPRLHFGLGDQDEIELITVRWPGGRQTEIQDVAANQILVVRP